MNNARTTIVWWRKTGRAKEQQERHTSDRSERRQLRRQADIYEQLADELERLVRVGNLNWAHLSTGEHAERALDPSPDGAYRHYAALMSKAARNGLDKEDTDIAQWFRVRKAIGDKKYSATLTHLQSHKSRN